MGNYKNAGSDYRPQGQPHRVKVHDFEDKAKGKVVPYGVYDVADNSGWVSIGITHDTAEFAVQSIRCWLEKMGRARYPDARELMIRNPIDCAALDCAVREAAAARWKLCYGILWQRSNFGGFAW